MRKTFADIRVGDTLYWGAPDMDHVSTTIVTDTHLNLDGEHMPKVCEVTFKTNEGFEFDMSNFLLDKHDCVIFTHQVNGNTIYIGTTKMAVANNIIKFLDNKIDFWASRKERLINRLVEDDMEIKL